MIARHIWLAAAYLCLLCMSLGAMPPPIQQPGNQNLPTPPKPSTLPKTPLPPKQPSPITQTPTQTPKTGAPLESVFSSPGIAALQGGQWVGRENLFNLSPDIGVFFEILSASSDKILISKQPLHDKVDHLLKGAGLTPHPIFGGQAPLPFYHILIMLHPIEKGYVAYCGCRLIESVQIKRVLLQPDIQFQAITWERQEMIVSPIDQLQDQVEKAIDAMTAAFADLAKSHKPTGTGS